MKKTTAILTALLVMAVLFASCSNGMGEKAEGSASASSSQKVMVSLGVYFENEIQKVAIDHIDANDPSLGTLTFWYKADPKWEQNNDIAGDTNGQFVMIPGYTGNTPATNIGYFTAGIWDFDVQVRNTSGTVLYSGSDHGVSIYTGSASLDITVTADNGRTGTVLISVQVPTTGNSEDLQMTYTGHASPITLTRGTTASNIRTFSSAPLDLTPGAYTFNFLYYDQSTTAQNGGASVAVNVFADQTTTISGLIEDGKWHSKDIIIRVPGFSSEVYVTAGSIFVTPTGTLQFSCGDSLGNAIRALSDHDITYTWLVNGVVKQDPEEDTNSRTFDFAPATHIGANAFGLYEVTCVISCADDNITAYGNCSVAVGYGIAEPPLSITCARTYAAPNDIVVLTIPTGKRPSALAYDGNSILAGYDKYENKAYFKMPSAAVAAITATLGDTYLVTTPAEDATGKVSLATPITYFASGETVNLVVRPAEGKQLTILTVNGDNIISNYNATTGIATFVMPNEAATVSATFTTP